ncbi:MAG: thiolase family protein [Candidatus Yanofskybacteria bacterium]|nr:thiolase family protein [Candidatus Yanofskybacteria bacterium]
MNKRIVISGSCRTPVGKSGGTRGNLSSLSAVELLVPCFEETLNRSGVAKDKLDQVIVGNCAQSSDAPNISDVAGRSLQFLRRDVAEEAAEISGIHVPAFSVNRNCGSGLQAVVSACQMLKAEEANIVLAGGTESMSNIPYISRDMRFGHGLGHSQFIDALWEGLTDPITGEKMGETAENIAERYKISREDQDEFAAQSHQKAFRAMREGKFRSQIVPLETGGKKVFQDEGINQALTRQHLSLYPERVFFVKGGTVHAGNSCSISDGASSFLVLTLPEALRRGIKPEAEILGYAFEACNPSYMGMGPYYAIPKALSIADVCLGDVDLFEINEAFAAQVLGCQRELGIPLDKLNVWGGAIALGHPVGATGAILTTKLIAMLKDIAGLYGVVSMCIGGGQGGAMVIKNWKTEFLDPLKQGQETTPSEE